MKTILHIDDSEADLLAFRILTLNKHADMRIKAAHDGQDALNLLANGFVPSVIVLDIVMPGMNGFTFLDTYTNDDRINEKAPVVMLSSSYNDNDKNKALSYELVKDYVCKPLDDNTVERILKAAGNAEKHSNIDIELM